VDKDTLPKVVRAIASSQPWRAACVEFARCTDYGERAHTSLPRDEMAPVLKHLLAAVEQNVTFGGTASIQDLAKVGCPEALLSVVEMQVKKAAKRTKEKTGENPVLRVGRRPTTNPRITKRKKSTTSPVGRDIVAASPVLKAMSAFSVRRVQVLDQSDTHLKVRVDGISGGEDMRIPFTVSREKQLREQIRELELRAKLTFVPEGRLHDLVQRELQAELES